MRPCHVSWCDRPTTLSWLGLFGMCLGLQPMRSAYRRGFQRDGAELWISTRQRVCLAPLFETPAPIEAHPSPKFYRSEWLTKSGLNAQNPHNSVAFSLTMATSLSWSISQTDPATALHRPQSKRLILPWWRGPRVTPFDKVDRGSPNHDFSRLSDRACPWSWLGTTEPTPLRPLFLHQFLCPCFILPGVNR